jgi:hypothetical protein
LIGVIVFGVAIFFVLAQFIDGRIAGLLGVAFVVVAGAAFRRWRARKRSPEKVVDDLDLTEEEANQLPDYAREGDREGALRLVTGAHERKKAESNKAADPESGDVVPLIGRDITWADIVNHAFRVLDFDRAGTVVDGDDHVKAGSIIAPYGYLLVESPILSQPARLPITHAFDFLLATTVFDEPRLADSLTANKAELLVTYSPKKLLPGGLAGSPHHTLHYALMTRGTLDVYYSEDDDAHMARPDPQQLFGPFVYEGPTQVHVSPELEM